MFLCSTLFTGQNKLVDALSIIKAIKQTQQEREAARARAMSATMPVTNAVSTNSGDDDDDVEMLTEVKKTCFVFTILFSPVYFFPFCKN